MHIIDQFDELYSKTPTKTLKKIADTEFSEMDITVRLGAPFGLLARYTTAINDNITNFSKKVKINHDIVVSSKNFIIEVKYLKNWTSTSGNKTNKKNWKVYQEDFNWLTNEIDIGFKGNRAFVIGWFNCVDHFSNLMQLGCTSGMYPLVDESKICYFPFLTKKCVNPTRTTDMVYDYSKAYRPLALSIIGQPNKNYECLFLGNKNNVFHFAIYY